jgi:hypothetical protein
MKRLIYLFLLVVILFCAGCSDGGSSAPPQKEEEKKKKSIVIPIPQELKGVWKYSETVKGDSKIFYDHQIIISVGQSNYSSSLGGPEDFLCSVSGYTKVRYTLIGEESNSHGTKLGYIYIDSIVGDTYYFTLYVSVYEGISFDYMGEGDFSISGNILNLRICNVYNGTEIIFLPQIPLTHVQYIRTK